MSIAAECKAYLVRRYEGEAYGEALFGCLANTAADDASRYKWRTLAQLERETKERIHLFLDGAGVAVAGTDESVRRGERDAERLATIGWRDLMQGFRRELKRLVTEFHEAEDYDRSGGELHDLLRRITAHEEALLQFVIQEIDGNQRDSLAAVRALLRNQNPDDES